MHGNFASPFRSLEIRGQLTAHDGWKPAEMVAVQKDVYSAFSHFLAREIVAAYDRKKPSGALVQAAVAQLRNWSGQMEKQMAAPLVVTLAFQQLRKRIAERASPGNSRLYELQMAPAIVQDILGNPQGWFHDQNDVLMSALVDALAEGRQIQGGDVKHWDYGKYNDLTIRHPAWERSCR